MFTRCFHNCFREDQTRLAIEVLHDALLEFAYRLWITCCESSLIVCWNEEKAVI